jgi:hypothetical protein
MDVEGAELLALQGMGETIKNNPNIKMIVEYFPLLLEKMGSSPKDVLNILTGEYGFQLYEIVDDYNAADAVSSMVLKYIDKPEELMNDYSMDKMYHINIFAIKRSNKDFQSIVSTRA